MSSTGVASRENYDHIFKLLLVGDSGVGKSSILIRFTDGDWSQNIGTTIGVDFKVKYLRAKKKNIKLTIWDTAGQERFRTLTSSYYRGAQGIILVYDVSKKSSFDSLKMWLKEIETYASYDETVKLLVANKIDLANEREVPRKMGEQFARENGMLYIECSAKTKVGIDQAFEEVTHKVLDTEGLLENTRPVKLSPDMADINKQPEESEGYCSYCGF